MLLQRQSGDVAAPAPLRRMRFYLQDGGATFRRCLRDALHCSAADGALNQYQGRQAQPAFPIERKFPECTTAHDFIRPPAARHVDAAYRSETEPVTGNSAPVHQRTSRKSRTTAKINRRMKVMFRSNDVGADAMTLTRPRECRPPAKPTRHALPAPALAARRRRSPPGNVSEMHSPMAD